MNPGNALMRNPVAGIDLFRIICFKYTRAQEQVMQIAFYPDRPFLPAIVCPLLTARAAI